MGLRRHEACTDAGHATCCLMVRCHSGSSGVPVSQDERLQHPCTPCMTVHWSIHPLQMLSRHWQPVWAIRASGMHAVDASHRHAASRIACGSCAPSSHAHPSTHTHSEHSAHSVSSVWQLCSVPSPPPSMASLDPPATHTHGQQLDSTAPNHGRAAPAAGPPCAGSRGAIIDSSDTGPRCERVFAQCLDVPPAMHTRTAAMLTRPDSSAFGQSNSLQAELLNPRSRENIARAPIYSGVCWCGGIQWLLLRPLEIVS